MLTVTEMSKMNLFREINKRNFLTEFCDYLMVLSTYPIQPNLAHQKVKNPTQPTGAPNPALGMGLRAKPPPPQNDACHIRLCSIFYLLAYRREQAQLQFGRNPRTNSAPSAHCA